MARKGIHGAKVECRKPNVLAQPAAVLDIGFSALRAKIARVNHASIALVALLLAQGAIPTGRGAIAGQILHEDNTPAAGVRVAAIAGDSSDAMAIVALTETDANGRYRLEDVPAGLHFLAAGPLRALTYFPGVVTLAEAQAIMVAANSFQEGRDFRLSNRSINPDVARLDVSSPGSLNVRGRFLVEGGGPIPKSVILKHSPAGVSFAPASTETPIIADSGGAFQATITGVNGGRIVLNGVEPSAYSVSAVMFGSDDALTHRATVVTGRELVVTFKSAGVQVTGRITSVLPSTDRPKVVLVGTTSVPGTFPMSVSRETIVGPDGQFTFSDVFHGAYEIRLAGAQSAPATKVDVDNADVHVLQVAP